MTLILKNKDTLSIDDFHFKCCVGRNGISNKKKEGDKKTPRGSFGLEHLYYREDKIQKPFTTLKCVKIKKNMAWCNDIRASKRYNKLIKINKTLSFEKLKRYDYKYDLLIPIKYNFEKPIVGLGSCIFIHLTKNYKSTAGCIALSKKDFLIVLKLINKKTRIKIN